MGFHWLLIISYFVTNHIGAKPVHQASFPYVDETSCLAAGFATDKEPADEYVPMAVNQQWECVKVQGQ